MKVEFTKVSDRCHQVTITRLDGSTEDALLDSRSFLRHDLAHFAVECELPLLTGFWGAIAAGGSLTDREPAGADLTVAERLAGPVQTLIRIEAPASAIRETLAAVIPDQATDDVATRIHERIRQLIGQWNATRYGDTMVVTWPED